MSVQTHVFQEKDEWRIHIEEKVKEIEELKIRMKGLEVELERKDKINEGINAKASSLN